MTCDPRKLNAFVIVDELVPEIYRMTRSFPVDERFGLQSQLRRAAVSVATNIVEGCARPSTRDYLHFVTIAISSASEARYLIGLAARLGLIQQAAAEKTSDGMDHVVRALQSLVTTIRNSDPDAGRRMSDAG